ncbi:MAG: phenylalanine--tRNA ligase subunit beta [Candidatus Thermoplasmatota archaeon]
MPVINFSYSDLCGLVGYDVPKAVLMERLPMIGADPRCADEATDEMSFEFFPDRPDLYSVEGVARALRAFLGREPGLRSYAVAPSDVELRVDPSVEGVRPHIWSALVEGLDVDDRLIRSMMDLQEKLHVTLGRNRRKVAIGLHDFSTVKPPFTYRAVGPHEVRFVPLQGDGEMDLAEILVAHEKGRAYSGILEGKGAYPVILDSVGEVLSFPPIINGVRTTVSESTRDVLVDCTGTDANAVRGAVNIVTTALAERGGRVRSVKVVGGGGMARAPDLAPRRIELDASYVDRWLGTRLGPGVMAECLGRMGHGATPAGDGVSVMVPPYRLDILHPVDLAEDVAIGHGFERFGDRLPSRFTGGRPDAVADFCSRLRPVMMGLGYTEVTALTLSSAAEQYDALGLERDPSAARILNPVTEDHELLRASLLPGLIGILRRNKHRELPQRIFETGEVVRGTKNRAMLSGVSVHPKASFTEAKSDVQSLMQAVGLRCEVAAAEHGAFIRGRCAVVMSEGNPVGTLGEVSPATLAAFGLGYPAAAFEIDAEELLALRSR